MKEPHLPRAALAAEAQCSHNDHMARNLVGARELKVRLGTYLRLVRQGQTLVVTDRGEPVAELRPIATEGKVDAILAKLEAGGAVARPKRKRLAEFRPIDSRGNSPSAAIIEDRADRF